jgi:hypothetical protein
MIVTAISLAAAILTSVPPAAVQAKPDFSGTWIVVSPADAAGQEETIRHDEKTFTKGHASGGGGHNFTYKLDGTESRNVLSVHAGEQIVLLAKASWEESALVIIEAVTYPDGRKRESRAKHWLDDKGLLHVEMVELADGKPQPPVHVVSRKTS